LSFRVQAVAPLHENRPHSPPRFPKALRVWIWIKTGGYAAFLAADRDRSKIARDITDRKLAEEALKEAQKVAEVALTSQLS
jgi:hypothetical protein